MNRGSTGQRWLLLLVLPSALGLLAFGVVGLLGNTRELRREARDESRAAARAEARSLRRTVEDRAFLDRIPERYRFSAGADGVLAWPSGLGPRDPAGQTSARPAYLGYPVQRLLDRAAALEFERDDAASALTVLEEGRALARDDEDRGVIEARLAWCAHRRADPARRDAALDALLALDGASPADRLSGLLLATASGRSEPNDLLDRLMALPDEERAITVDRLRDLAADRVVAIESELGRRLERRRLLRLLQSRLPTWRDEEAFPQVVAQSGDLLVIHRARKYLKAEGGLEGALVPPAVLIAAAGLDPQRFAFGATPPEDAIPALPLVAALPARFAADRGPAEFGFTAILLAGLAIAFVGGLLLATRALRREAQAARLRSEFLTSVTHELKTPLASIRLIAEMLEQGVVNDPERRDEYHRLLSGETARLSMLIENVLDLGRMERGERAYDRRPVTPADVVRDAVEVFRPVAKRDGLEVEAHLRAAPGEAELDRGALVQALLNLLENGRKYALDGGRLELEDECRNGVYRLRLRDFGPGIPAGEIDRVFERFTRGSAQADGRVAGVGLGLHLARRIVEDHGGRLRAELPDDGRGGALFVMELPVSAKGEDR